MFNKILFTGFLMAGAASLFSAIDANGWVLIISALSFGIVQVLTLILAYLAKQKVEEVKSTLQAEVKEVAGKVEVVHKATNSLVDQIVSITEKESFARGEKSEKDKEKVPVPELAGGSSPPAVPGSSVGPIVATLDVLKKQVTGIPEKTAVKVVERLKVDGDAQSGG